MHPNVERIQRFPVSVTAPAVANEIIVQIGGSNLSIPGLGAWRILSLTFRLTTSATVVNRFVQVFMDDTTTTYAKFAAADLQAASTQRVYGAFEGSTSAGNNGNFEHLPWPTPGPVLYPGHRLRTNTLNLDPADQYDQVALLVEEMPSGRYFQVLPGDTVLAEPWLSEREVGQL